MLLGGNSSCPLIAAASPTAAVTPPQHCLCCLCPFCLCPLALQDLRSLMPLLPPQDLAIAGQAMALSQWHQVGGLDLLRLA